MNAVKYDGDKPMLSLVPTHAILGMGRALTYGAKKYDNFNYKQGEGLNWDRYSSALLRHLFAWLGGENADQESGLNHLDHMLACAAMLSDAVYSNIGKDTRFNTDSIPFGVENPPVAARERIINKWLKFNEPCQCCN